MLNYRIKALVTGNAGFIGTYLCHELLKHPYVKCVKGFDLKQVVKKDVCSLYDIQSVIYYQPDVVFHLAANTQVEYSPDLSENCFLTNAYGTYLLLRELPMCRFVLVSSVHCQVNNSVYSASKLAAESLVDCYTKMNLIDGVTLRFTSVVGKNMTHGVVKDIMTKLRSDSKYLDLTGEAPGSTRPFVHVTDTVNAMLHYGINSNDNEIHAISTINSINILDVAHLVMKTMSIEKLIRWAGTSSEWLGDVKQLYRIEHLAKDFSLCYPTSEAAIVQAVKDNL